VKIVSKLYEIASGYERLTDGQLGGQTDRRTTLGNLICIPHYKVVEA